MLTLVYERRRPRDTASSKAPFWAVVFFAITAIISFSLRPLRLFTIAGFSLVALFAFATLVYLYLWATRSPRAA